jgi:hypothetical protein
MSIHLSEGSSTKAADPYECISYMNSQFPFEEDPVQMHNSLAIQIQKSLATSLYWKVDVPYIQQTPNLCSRHYVVAEAGGFTHIRLHKCSSAHAWRARGPTFIYI